MAENGWMSDMTSLTDNRSQSHRTRGCMMTFELFEFRLVWHAKCKSQHTLIKVPRFANQIFGIIPQCVNPKLVRNAISKNVRKSLLYVNTVWQKIEIFSSHAHGSQKPETIILWQCLFNPSSTGKFKVDLAYCTSTSNCVKMTYC